LMRAFFPFLLTVFIGCGVGGGEDDVLEQAETLFRAGRYSQALLLYEELCSDTSLASIELRFRLAETAVLASQAERSRDIRRRARNALEALSGSDGIDSLAVGQLWRRLAWEMARDSDSLQAYSALGMALELSPELANAFEEEWLLRGRYASRHLADVAGLTDSIAGTPSADSLLRTAAERHIVELDRVPLVRTDLRGEVLFAKSRLLEYTGGRSEDLLRVLTELDRMGLLDPPQRQRRMEVLISLAISDIQRGDTVLARERLMEAWNSTFTGIRVEAAYHLGLLAEGAGNPSDALTWYTRACSVAPGLTSQAAISSAARRDSLRYLTTP
jgi:PAS domain-containing protein